MCFCNLTVFAGYGALGDRALVELAICDAFQKLKNESFEKEACSGKRFSIQGRHKVLKKTTYF